ncbi:tol-pal system-associated acyl-CoA thioesterase [Sphingomonas ginsenosidivorax]|uniref:Tol-pal system-associated acyl-CoA thioesterase n=1 Tax=Sphingomonas ginsenosidivorax TaxID=862135 RepID=A0A5C6UI18_9SPHN|nr:tol-pal system-associated acyl-CoA thioesterase [Sphingomonas ginsenosidivorax]TXC72044.1 tol-pal system-associated acyl-CoA thioesterase [Sphingomonas ginsenosidivorax]
MGQDLPTAGRFDGREHRFPVRVYFEDTDLSGVVYHANYLRYMERARSDMLRVAGIDQRATHEAGEGAYAVASLNIRYAAPARLDDALLIVSRLKQVRAASVSIHQRVMRDGVVLAEADVVAAMVAAGGRPKRQPRAWTDIYERLVWQGDS